MLLLLGKAIESQIGIQLAVGGGIEAVALSRRRSPWIGELRRAGVRHVVEVHAAEALLIVDGHSHLLAKMIDVRSDGDASILQEESRSSSPRCVDQMHDPEDERGRGESSGGVGER